MRLSISLFIFIGLFFPVLSWSGEVVDKANSNSLVNSLPSTPHHQNEALVLEESFQRELKGAEKDPFHFWSNFMYMLGILGLVVSMLFLLVWLMKKIVYNRLLYDNATSLIKITDRRSLSPKTVLYVVEIEGKQLILGEALNGITKLAEKNILADFSVNDKETQESFRQLQRRKE